MRKWLKKLADKVRGLRNYVPYIDLCLDLGRLAEIRTVVVRNNKADHSFEYIALNVRLFNKWPFRIRLYSPYYRREVR